MSVFYASKDEFGRTVWKTNESIDISFEYTKKGKSKELREISLYQVNASEQGVFFLIGRCYKNGYERTFNITRVSSNISFNDKSYQPIEFIKNVVGIDPSGDFSEPTTDDLCTDDAGSTNQEKAGCLKMILVVIFAAFIISLFDTSETESVDSAAQQPVQQQQELPAEPNNVIVINDDNYNELVEAIKNACIHHINLLSGKFKADKNKDPSFFIKWRNNIWMPKYTEDRTHYNEILENNRVYINSRDGMAMYVALNDLSTISLNIMQGIKDQDKLKLKEVSIRVKEISAYFDELTKTVETKTFTK